MSSSTDIFNPVLRGQDLSVRSARIDQSVAELALSPEKIREQARSQGFSVGWVAGQRAADAAVREEAERRMAEEQRLLQAFTTRLESAISALERAAESLDQRATPSVESAADVIAAAAYDVAEAVIGHTVATSTDTGLEAVRRVLAHTPPGRDVLVRLAPHDAETVRMVAPEGLPWQDRQVHIIADPDLRSGDAVAECDSTTLDGRIAPALARVKEILAP